mmetsp:Transcript_8247/g.17587  ORF Transcript_8247/g.17587 Transcript_8247/m.17587 type:complete len:159 (+) Transcript_8247:67-543(+)
MQNNWSDKSYLSYLKTAPHRRHDLRKDGSHYSGNPLNLHCFFLIIFLSADISCTLTTSFGRLTPYLKNASFKLSALHSSTSPFSFITSTTHCTSFTPLSMAVLHPSPIEGVMACAASPMRVTLPSLVVYAFSSFFSPGINLSQDTRRLILALPNTTSF